MDAHRARPDDPEPDAASRFRTPDGGGAPERRLRLGLRGVWRGTELTSGEEEGGGAPQSV